MAPELVPTLYDYLLADVIDERATLCLGDAALLFTYFKEHPLFNWKESHNGCEARADAVCVLLEAWQVPHYKVWLFSGSYLKKHIGGLKQHWNYHVAPVLPVKENGQLVFYVIDPATGPSLQPMYEWAAAITQYPHSYHFIKLPHWYIFHRGKISASNWHRRNLQNRKWMIQGLAGINGLNVIGKAKLCFNKGRVKNMAKAFEAVKRQSPFQ